MFSTDQTEQEFSQFIEFGQLFDKDTRRQLVFYLQNKWAVTKEPSVLNNEKELSQEYMTRALDKVFDNPELIKVGNLNPTLANQIIHDTLAWLRKASQQISQDNPLQDEFNRLQSWKDRPLRIFSETWYHLTNFLKETYERQDFDISFYEKYFDEIFRDRRKFIDDITQLSNEAQEKLPVQQVIYDLLAQWEGLLIAKSLQYELEAMEQQTEGFSQQLYAKVGEYLKMVDLVAPFAEEIGRFWDMSRGIWQESHFEVLNQYALLLQNEKSVQQLADLLGRLREAQTEIAEESFDYTIAKVSYKTTFEQKTEIGGIHESDDLNNLLPSEIALLSVEATEMAFFKRFADKQLLTFQYQGKKPVVGYQTFTESREKTRQKEKGPFIVCVDVSASMEGLPEQIAKVLCFAILKMASKDQRKAYLISFSTGMQTINLLNLENSLDQVVKFLTMTFAGGTDIHPPMFEAMRMLQTHDYKEADVLVISDFIMYEVREDLQKRMQEERRKGTKFHSLTVSENTSNPAVASLFDNFWVYNPENKAIMRQLASDLLALE
ncbi:MAG: VWA domain-containing protein [Verrucomicrobia bacterium]|nr:VWA domain-containing protein [Cytophagales bacterium]